MQQDPDHEAHYAHENATVGYAANKYEVEARYYGRLADHTVTKDTGPAGAHLGKTAWALRGNGSLPHSLIDQRLPDGRVSRL